VNAIFEAPEGGDELGGEVDRRAILDEDAQSFAELDDEPGGDGPGELDLGEMHALAYAAPGSTGRLGWLGWFLCHPANLPGLRRPTMRPIY